VSARIGPYRLIRKIGQGEACELWDVERQGQTGRLAMKYLPPGPKQTKENIALLKHEFAVGKPLDHPNVIRTLELQSGAQSTYLILELFRAANLKQWVQQGVATFAFQVEKIIRQAATGLGYFHAQGWTHRDVKPGNFLSSEAGEVKLIDFALAQKKRGALGRLLSKAKVQGTQSYMSPEQIRAQAVDPRSDVYSFGCVVHELLASKPPFTGTNTQELLQKHLNGKPPSLTTVDRNITPEFAGLVQRMIAKDADARPASMEAFLAQLDKVKIFHKTPARPPSETVEEDTR